MTTKSTILAFALIVAMWWYAITAVEAQQKRIAEAHRQVPATNFDCAKAEAMEKLKTINAEGAVK